MGKKGKIDKVWSRCYDLWVWLEYLIVRSESKIEVLFFSLEESWLVRTMTSIRSQEKVLVQVFIALLCTLSHYIRRSRAHIPRGDLRQPEGRMAVCLKERAHRGVEEIERGQPDPSCQGARLHVSDNLVHSQNTITGRDSCGSLGCLLKQVRDKCISKIAKQVPYNCRSRNPSFTRLQDVCR